MSSQSTPVHTNNQMTVLTNTAKIFLRNNRYQSAEETNNTSYDPYVLSAGTLMGRNSTTGKLVPLSVLSTDGSQLPVGVLAEDVSLDAGETKTVAIVDMGDVAEDKVILYHAGQTLDSVVSSRRLRDHLQAQGIKLIDSDQSEMTAVDPNV
jgi:hypothetical protein